MDDGSTEASQTTPLVTESEPKKTIAQLIAEHKKRFADKPTPRNDAPTSPNRRFMFMGGSAALATAVVGSAVVVSQGGRTPELPSQQIEPVDPLLAEGKYFEAFSALMAKYFKKTNNSELWQTLEQARQDPKLFLATVPPHRIEEVTSSNRSELVKTGYSEVHLQLHTDPKLPHMDLMYATVVFDPISKDIISEHITFNINAEGVIEPKDNTKLTSIQASDIPQISDKLFTDSKKLTPWVEASSTKGRSYLLMMAEQSLTEPKNQHSPKRGLSMFINQYGSAEIINQEQK